MHIQMLYLELTTQNSELNNIKGQQGCGSGSGFQISLDPDPVSAQILEQKKECRKVSKSDYQQKT